MANTIKIGINGFGRIGRSAAKIIMDTRGMELVAINDLTDTKTLSNLLKYDTAYGAYEKKVTFDENTITIGKKKIRVYNQKDPREIPWKENKVDVVIESTGVFVKDGAAKMHLEAGAKKVIVSAPTKGTGGIKTYLRGVNDTDYKDDQVISNASCTTNCIGPVISVLKDEFGIKKALMTTIHGYTSSQNLQDGPHKDMRRGRAAAQNVVPTTTGAAIATTEAIPELKGKFDGAAVRVPVITGSITDFTVLLNKKVSVDEVNRAFVKASKTPRYKGVLAVTDDPLVSSDIIGSSFSAIVNTDLTKVIDHDFVKVFAWYDNEWGYANRLVEQVKLVM